MKNFADVLKELPAIDDLARLEIYAADSYEPCHVIENQPGKQGSLAVYYKVAVDFGGIGPKAAEKALELFCEHTEDARAHPGKHPNIDWLFQVIDSGEHYSVRARKA